MSQNKNVQPKKAKAQLKKEKLLNATMKSVSKKTAISTGVIAVQMEKSIFQIEQGVFVKVYSIKGLDNSEMRKENLIKSLLGCAYRLRVTSYLYAGSQAPIFFLSVFFYGSSYAEIYNDIAEFDTFLEKVLKLNIRIAIETCNVCDILMFHYMNYNGQMKKINEKTIFKRASNWKRDLWGDITINEQGFQLVRTDKYGNCYMAIQYPKEFKRLFHTFRNTGCVLLSSVDIQTISEKYIPNYQIYIEELYNGQMELEAKTLTNATFMFAFIANSDKERKVMDLAIKEIFSKNGFVLTPCVGIEETVFDSIATMGVKNFECMSSINEKCIANLLL